MYADLQMALGRSYPEASFRIPSFLRFGSWIGGDRDGNPNVTVSVTEEALREHKAIALRLYLRALDQMHGHLSTGARYGISPELAESIEADVRQFRRKLAYRDTLRTSHRTRCASSTGPNPQPDS
jgi:phosphoenolpyruvate carboxylase